uniref:Elongation factor Ts, mitochondrial n=1 Tax=Balbiania investiens TaxID=111861 RepID=A0A4D6BNZ3_9FLOR|nr:translation elongation factor Ts [Balbiania investiens]QBX88663.1 translation elongation factor Ts [Balbiania investiens]
MTIKISAQYVKELRSQTGAGMMDCKKALQESDGNIEKAIESLRQKGLASASKKLNRTTAEGLIESYIHAGSRIGVIVEVNCETDFVARRIEFQELSRNIAMQIAACPAVEYVATRNIPDAVIERERYIEAGKEDLEDKPENIRIQIVEGRVKKRMDELSLLNQPFIRNTDITIDDLIKSNISLMGENIRVRRFVRFSLGEGIKKSSNNLAEEIENMTNK